MNEKIIRPGVIQRIVNLTRSRNQEYSQEAVSDILTAFFDVIEEAISNGDSIIMRGYMMIEPQYRAERNSRNVRCNERITIPEHFRVRIKSGSKLNQAAERYTEKQLGIKSMED